MTSCNTMNTAQPAPTPESDEAAAILNRQSDFGLSGHVSIEHARKLERERDELKRWKQEMLEVWKGWDEVEKAIRARPNSIMGRVISDEVLRLIEERDKLHEGEKWAAGIFCQILAAAISGMADAAVIANDVMGPLHALECVKTLAELSKKNRAALTEKDAQNVALREALKEYEEALCDGPENCTYLRYESVSEKAKAALSTPPPAVVPLEDVKMMLVEELKPIARQKLSSEMEGEEAYLKPAKHPLP